MKSVFSSSIAFVVLALTCILPHRAFCIPREGNEYEDFNDDDVGFEEYEDVGSEDKSGVFTPAPVPTLEELETKLQSDIFSLMLKSYPYVMSAKSDLNISEQCLRKLFHFALEFKSLKDWAVRLFDANGKLTGGILEGTSVVLGDYDECLGVVIGGGSLTDGSPTGMYCLLEIKPPPTILNALRDFHEGNKSFSHLATTNTVFKNLRKVKMDPDEVIFRLGICLPSSCSIQDIHSIVSAGSNGTGFPTRVKRCETKNVPVVQLHQFIIAGIVGGALALVIICTIIDGLYSICSKPNEENSVQKRETPKVILSFSALANTRNLFETELDGDAMDPIRGIKVLTVIFIVFVHTYCLQHPLHIVRYRSAFSLFKFTESSWFGLVANASGGMETVFFIAGFVSVYSRWKHFQRSNILAYTFKFFILLYIRMTLLQTVVIGLFFLFPLIGIGPLWGEFVDEPIEVCKQKWWTNLLYIQNFAEPRNSCLYHTWVLAVIMQSFVMTSCILWVLNRKPIIGIVFAVSCVLGSILAVGLLTGLGNYSATSSLYFYDYRTFTKMWKYVYIQAYSHLGSYCIGMIIAYVIAEKPTLKIRNATNVLFWCSAGCVCLSVIYGLHEYRKGHPMEKKLSVFYAAVHRPAWALAIGWIIYACAAGYGGIINSILSWKAFVPLERLCYFIYLFHVPVMYYHGGTQRERLFMGHFEQMMNFFAYLVISLLLSFACYIVFQGPYIALEGLAFSKNINGIWQVAPEGVSQPAPGNAEHPVKEMEPREQETFFTKSDKNAVAVEI